MKNVLILTCSTGEGHNSAAYALRDVLTQKGLSCQVADPVSFQSDRMEHMVASLYNNMIKKTPAVFGAVYKLGDLYSSSRLPSPVYWANSRYAETLRRYILSNHFDAVICTHLYGMEAMTYIRRNTAFQVPCYGVLTDYTCIPFTGETELDGYFVPHLDMKKELMEKGVPGERIFVTGIPVGPSFARHPDRLSARKKLNISDEKLVFLVMTGGIGCENMLGLCSGLLRQAKPYDQIYVLTGKNNELKNKLDEKYFSTPQLITVPFTRDVATYMAAADVMISKPGGLSSTEAAVVNVPLVHVNAIPGCETCNARFYQEHGLALSARNTREAVRYAKLLTRNEEKARLMRFMQQTCINPHAAQDIVSKVIADHERLARIRTVQERSGMIKEVICA